jgi:hypothetical protein
MTAYSSMKSSPPAANRRRSSIGETREHWGKLAFERVIQCTFVQTKMTTEGLNAFAA